jgi:hypothetical protein
LVHKEREANMAIGWVTDLAAAEAYFLTHRLETTAWDALTVTSSKDEKTAALRMAYDRLRFCRDFSIPATPTADQTERLQTAQCETAYYLAMHLLSEDRRKGVQAQGVVGAGVVKETYAEAFLQKIPLPPIVYEIMEEFNDALPFYVREVARDEDEAVDEDVSEF